MRLAGTSNEARSGSEHDFEEFHRGTDEILLGDPASCSI
jgi:hypothetical protein